jgi:hypothetical protein
VKPAIVGEAPSMRTSRPFAGASGIRLAQLAGVSLDELRARYRLVNVLRHWPGPNPCGKGSAFPLSDARPRAGAIRLPPGSLLCGRRVARAFGRAGLAFFEWDDCGVAVIPHPSGISRWWNEPSHVDEARRFLEGALRAA